MGCSEKGTNGFVNIDYLSGDIAHNLIKSMFFENPFLADHGGLLMAMAEGHGHGMNFA